MPSYNERFGVVREGDGSYTVVDKMSGRNKRYVLTTRSGHTTRLIV